MTKRARARAGARLRRELPPRIRARTRANTPLIDVIIRLLFAIPNARGNHGCSDRKLTSLLLAMLVRLNIS